MAEPRPFSADTSLEAQRVLIERWRSMSPAQKAEIVTRLCADAEAMARAGILNRHPRATEREIRLRLGALRYGRDLMIEAFAWDPDEHGL